MPNAAHAPSQGLQGGSERPLKRRRVGEHVAPSATRQRKPRYRPAERNTPAASVLTPLSGFDFLDLRSGHQNPLRQGPARPPPDPGGPSLFGRRLLEVAGKEMPLEEEAEPELQLDERTIAKVHKNLARLSTINNLAQFTTAMHLPTPGEEAAFYKTAINVAQYNGEVVAFNKGVRSKLRERRRQTERLASLDTTGAGGDRASSYSNSRPSSASSHSTTITVPPSPPSRAAAFSSVVDALRAEDLDHRGLSKDFLKQRMSKAGYGFAYKDVGFDAYISRAAEFGIVQLEAGCIRLMPEHRKRRNS